MKDTDLRGIVLQQFYDNRKHGQIGVGYDGMVQLEVTNHAPKPDLLRICSQLKEHGLIQWDAVVATSAGGGYEAVAGAGRISARGIDVIEGGAVSTIALKIDNSQHTHTVNVSGGSVGNLQVGGANNTQQQNVTHAVERLLATIDESGGTDEDKVVAKSKFAAFVHGAIKAASEGGARGLIELLKR
jgi:hypothetical protein